MARGGNPYELRDTLRRLGLHPEQTLTERGGTIAGGFEVGGEVIEADPDTLWEMAGETSGLALVHGENGKRWLKEYVGGNRGYAFTVERPFLFREPVSREEMGGEKYGGVRVEGGDNPPVEENEKRVGQRTHRGPSREGGVLPLTGGVFLVLRINAKVRAEAQAVYLLLR